MPSPKRVPTVVRADEDKPAKPKRRRAPRRKKKDAEPVAAEAEAETGDPDSGQTEEAPAERCCGTRGRRGCCGSPETPAMSEPEEVQAEL